MNKFKLYLVECSDENLCSFDDKYGIKDCCVLRRGNSYKYNLEHFTEAQKNNSIVLTNDETLLLYVQIENKRYPIYLWRKNKWVWIHDIYENLRKENNLLAMLYAGTFDE